MWKSLFFLGAMLITVYTRKVFELFLSSFQQQLAGYSTGEIQLILEHNIYFHPKNFRRKSYHKNQKIDLTRFSSKIICSSCKLFHVLGHIKKRKEHIEYPRKNFEILLENRMEEIKHY